LDYKEDQTSYKNLLPKRVCNNLSANDLHAKEPKQLAGIWQISALF